MSASTFSTELPVVIFSYLPGQNPALWREIGQGPGVFRIDTSLQAAVRARNIGDDELKNLTNDVSTCNWITFLNLSENRKITDEGMRALAAVPQLTGINLSSCSLTNTGIARITVLTRLEYLDLSYCNRFSDIGLRHLRKLSRLTYLDLQGCVKVSQKGIAMLERKNLSIHR